MANTVGTRHPVQLAAMVVAAVFLLVGVLGFIPGATTEYDGMTFAGHESTAMLLGVFHVSILHNIVHLLFGVVGPGARAYRVRGNQLPHRWRHRLRGAVAVRTADRHRQRGQLRPAQHRGQLAAPHPGHRHDRPGRRPTRQPSTASPPDRKPWQHNELVDCGGYGGVHENHGEKTEKAKHRAACRERPHRRGQRRHSGSRSRMSMIWPNCSVVAACPAWTVWTSKRLCGVRRSASAIIRSCSAMGIIRSAVWRM